MPSKREKENEKRKVKKRGQERKQKVKVKTLEILLSAHARTLQADIYILHLDQKAVKCTTCKRVCGKFSSLKHDSDQKTTRLASKRVFRQNLQEQMG